MSRGLGAVQRSILLCLDRQLHFGMPSEGLCLVIFGADTPAARASISRALRRLRAGGLVECFAAPSISEELARPTEGRRLSLWNQIIARQEGGSMPRKWFKLTRKARREFGLPFWHAGWRYPCQLRIDGQPAVLSDRFFRRYPPHRPPVKAARRWQEWARLRGLLDP